MYTTTVTAEGQVMIPKEILQQLNIQAGSQIDFEIYEGKLVLIPVIENIQAAFGLLKANKSVSLEEMNYAITQRVIEEYDQS
jgi:AbrB family looped-hinge helix DNA binding protein